MCHRLKLCFSCLPLLLDPSKTVADIIDYLSWHFTALLKEWQYPLLLQKSPLSGHHYVTRGQCIHLMILETSTVYFKFIWFFWQVWQKAWSLGALWQKLFCFSYLRHWITCINWLFFFLWLYLMGAGSELSAVVRAVSYTHMLFCILTLFLCMCVAEQVCWIVGVSIPLYFYGWSVTFRMRNRTDRICNLSAGIVNFWSLTSLINGSVYHNCCETVAI